MFWKKTQINSDEYEKLHKKITELVGLIDELKINVTMLQTDCSNLRGQFNRKLQGIKKEEKDLDDSDMEKGINNPVILPDHGNPFKYR